MSISCLFIWTCSSLFPSRTLWSSQQSLLSTTRASCFPPHHFFGVVFLCIFARLVLYTVLSPCWKLICYKSCLFVICYLVIFISSVVYFIVLFMRLSVWHVWREQWNIRGYCMSRFTNVCIIIIIIIQYLWRAYVCSTQVWKCSTHVKPQACLHHEDTFLLISSKTSK